MVIGETDVQIPEGWRVVSAGEQRMRASYEAPDGTVDLACHVILPGIVLMGIELSCRALPVSNPFAATPHSINWCSGGRCEVDLGEEGFAVVGEGTLCLSTSTAASFAYPTARYQGFEYYVDIDQIEARTWSLLDAVGLGEHDVLTRVFPEGRTLTVVPEGELLEVVRRIEREVRQDAPRMGRLVLLTLALFTLLAERDPAATSSSCVYLQRSQREMAEAVYRQLTSDMTAAPDLAGLSRSLGVSEASLRAYFAKVYGESPAAFARRRRLEQARELLAKSDQPVGDVSVASGYANQSKFAAAFRRAYGVSPVEFRRRARLFGDDESALRQIGER